MNKEKRERMESEAGPFLSDLKRALRRTELMHKADSRRNKAQREKQRSMEREDLAS